MRLFLILLCFVLFPLSALAQPFPMGPRGYYPPPPPPYTPVYPYQYYPYYSYPADRPYNFYGPYYSGRYYQAPGPRTYYGSYAPPYGYAGGYVDGRNPYYY